MSDVLNLQEDQPEVPSEEKGSHLSLVGCHASYHSWALCFAK